MPDWITDFISATSTIRAPENFRLWAAITAIAGALERKVYTVTDVNRLYPNLYVVLTGEPASGKTNSVREARKTLVAAKNLKLGPDNPTKASFLDQFELAERQNGFMTFHALTVICEEFGVFIKARDDEFITDLTTLFDNPEIYTAPRRQAKSIALEKPTLNILACATPAALGKFPDSAWGEGFTSRVLFIYGARNNSIRDAFRPRVDLDLDGLGRGLTEFFTNLHGEFEWDEDARQAYNEWYNNGMQPRPDYGRLEFYNGRRDTHAMKLAMISAVSSGHGLNVTLDDFNRAKLWLLSAEIQMPNVFIAMTQASDGRIIDDLHHAMWTEYAKVEREKRKPVTRKFVWKFLEQRVTSDRIEKIIQTAENSGHINKSGFDGWTPVPRNQPNGKGS